MTFLDIVRKQGFQSIKEFLDSSPMIETPDFTERELRAIRKAEAATEAFLGATA